MKASVLDEPLLEFGDGGRHEDIRFGIMQHGLLNSTDNASQIRVGLVGTGETIEATQNWLLKCSNEIPAKENNHKNLFPHFPGFREDTCFAMKCSVPERAIGRIRDAELERARAKGGNDAIENIASIFGSQLEEIDERENIDVAVCALPSSILGEIDSDSAGKKFDVRYNFRGLLKAVGMQRRFPTQILRPTTYGAKVPKSFVGSAAGTYERGTTQDEATRAWNFFVALVYKSGIPPWRLPRESNRLESCYVGVSFYRSQDSSTVMTSMAQIFDERGEGMVLRGGPVELTKDDRTPHLKTEDAHDLLREALKRYKSEHRHLPARVVVHKTSVFNDAERDGFRSAIEELDIDLFDLVSIGTSNLRLFRSGEYPPLRGSHLILDNRNSILYTKASCSFYETYTGQYVPHPLHLRLSDHDSGQVELATETLALSKLNWNSTQMDGSMPITLRAARGVGEVLKYLGEDAQLQFRYSYYM